MKQFFNYLGQPLVICAIGAAVVGYGELKGAVGDGGQPGGTISEWFKAQPLWVKLFIFWVIGAICCHLAEWRINDEGIVFRVTTLPPANGANKSVAGGEK